MTRDTLPHLVIIGGGFAGLWATRALASARVRITLVDRRNHHLFQPLLYQVATAGLSAPDIAAPLRHILGDQRNVEVRLGEVTSIDKQARQITLADGSALGYDTLMLCTGATQSGADKPALTDWLHDALQRLSGKPDDQPLTFADLHAAPRYADNNNEPDYDQTYNQQVYSYYGVTY